jgi:hypothetical protein
MKHPPTSLLNQAFVYVPPTRQEADGLLSRWRRTREAQRQEQKALNVTEIKRKANK